MISFVGMFSRSGHCCFLLREVKNWATTVGKWGKTNKGGSKVKDQTLPLHKFQIPFCNLSICISKLEFHTVITVICDAHYYNSQPNLKIASSFTHFDGFTESWIIQNDSPLKRMRHYCTYYNLNYFSFCHFNLFFSIFVFCVGIPIYKIEFSPLSAKQQAPVFK